MANKVAIRTTMTVSCRRVESKLEVVSLKSGRVLSTVSSRGTPSTTASAVESLRKA